MLKKRILYVITKSNFGVNENCFSFTPIMSGAKEQPLLNVVKQVVGGPTKLYFV